jgi:hypothetical protein
MNKLFGIVISLALSSTIYADTNTSVAAVDSNTTHTSSDINETANTLNPKQLDKHLKEQMAREETFAKTQEFKKGEDYNLTEHQVDPKDLENIKVDEPLYDFNMDDVYD